MIWAIIANLFGITIYFYTRYSNRTNKDIEFSTKKWINENLPELIPILLFNIALMILVLNGGLSINISSIFPQLGEGVTLAGDISVSFIVGLVVTHLIYEGYKKILIK